MGWDKIVELIIAVGLPAAEKIWQKVAAGGDPTQADWDEIKAAAAQMSRDRALAMLAAKGIDPASDQGKLILSLVG